jgi:ankyrin repeat protein
LSKQTPLHLAIVRGHLDVVRFLVHEGAKLDVTDSEQRTPLVKATLSGSQNPQLQYQICTVLLSGGADTCKQ